MKNSDPELARDGQLSPVDLESAGTAPGVAFELVVMRLDLNPEDVLALASCLSEGERQRAKCFVFDRDRRRFIVARTRLRQLLSSRLGVSPASVEFSYGVCGKPQLSRRFAEANLRFNLSHSADIAVFGFAKGREIGIDVEAVREMSHAEDLAARFYSRRENDAYRALDLYNRPQGFFNCWTRKEAFIKALGDGLSYPLDRFEVSLAPGEPARLIRVDETAGDDCGWEIEGFSPAPGFVGAVVFEKMDPQFGLGGHSGRTARNLANQTGTSASFSTEHSTLKAGKGPRSTASAVPCHERTSYCAAGRALWVGSAS